MAFLTWGDQYMVHIAEIDTQHKKLFDMVNEMHDSMRAGKGYEAMGKILKGLTDYVKTHFATEERLMTAHGFPGYVKHKNEHDKLTQAALALYSDFEAGKPVLTIDLMTFLKNWLSDHILGTDKQYGPFLNSKGIK
ncbi:MAG: hemerythrin family protein [Nitrospirales bacterium]|nr:hemerythrin family protein [Nitrospirales bacterium]